MTLKDKNINLKGIQKRKKKRPRYRLMKHKCGFHKLGTPVHQFRTTKSGIKPIRSF